jgi:hypothetical protein
MVFITLFTIKERGMNMYKVIFAKNEPISVQVVSTDVSNDNYCYYEHDRGHLIFAMMRAESEHEAMEAAKVIGHDMETKVFGRNSIL